MVNTERFSVLSLGVDEPESAHPGYAVQEASVDVRDNNQTLYFVKVKEGGFKVTLFYNPTEDGKAPAISLGFVRDEVVDDAVRYETISIDGRIFNLGNTRALRRIL